MSSSPDTKSAVWGWIKDSDPENNSTDQLADPSSDNSDNTAGKSACALDNSTAAASSSVAGCSANSRKPSFKKRLRPLGDLKRLAVSSSESVGVMAGGPLIPSPSHLSVEQCYELLAKPPLGVATAAQTTEQ